MKFPPVIYMLAISFLASLTIFYKSARVELYLKLFPPFLLLSLANEILAFYLINKAGVSTMPLYNFFSIFEFCFYLFVTSLFVGNVSVKKIIRIVTISFAVIASINILFIQGISTFHTVTFSLGCLLVVTSCIYYFLEVFQLPRSVNLVKLPAFWICCGLLVYYCCSLPLYGFINVWAHIPFVVRNFSFIFSILNFILYSLFTIAFLCIRTRKYTLSLS